MLSVHERLDLYRQEKVHLDDELFGEPFPAFKDWDKQFVEEYNRNHITVTVEEADKIMDKFADTDAFDSDPTLTGPEAAVEAMLADEAAEDADEETVVTAEVELEVVEDDGEAAREAAAQARERATDNGDGKPAKKVRKAKAPAKVKTVKAKAASKPSRKGAKKSEKAREILKELRKADRQTKLKALRKIGLSDAAASTYMYKYAA